ncbi:iron chelate uptake ABC transporter family permease subunit [Pseudarthrobacter sp. BIM B-2242]|uniref:iron chelate uptake ABC transporter family permease subunit n=1 Tax=Pseudarthrobacter sp. BIM B-2242 TaxID=2772401 RepID=UPI00168AEC67|nr:iron chelate uptake ABC transporter family permease subunit [Pseudarthrobacter sp. BIM B-2242]QOD03430.1 iron chelate uptake ABC transporter family permease subunit [Pseudarthrobacter sp. BIM B-2242]
MPETATPSPAISVTPGAPTLKPAARKPGARLRNSIRNAPPRLVIGILLAATVAAVVFFLFSDLKGNVGYVLPRRALKVAAMLLVAVAVGVSTLLFQTVTANRILTPSIMGFDSLYILVQTALVFTVSAAAVTAAPPTLQFGVEVVLMVAFSALLYRWMFTGATRSLHLLLLVGIILGSLFRGFSSLLQRLMEPSEFIILQDLFFASFNNVDPALLGVSAVIIGVVCVGVWRARHTLDVLALGRELAINVGVDHRRVVMRSLLACSLLVAVSTALVGPVTFFGLLVVSLGYQLCRGFNHARLIPIVVLIGAVALVGGQLILERVFGFATALSVVIEFAGGILFLYLLLKGSLK